MGVLYVGTYTDELPHVNGKGAGVHAFQITPSGRELKVEPLGAFGGKVNPAFIHYSQKGVLYSTTEVPEKEGTVRAYAVQGDGSLLQTDEWGTKGPRHIAFRENRLYLAGELSNTLIAFEIQEDGSLVWKETFSTLPSHFRDENTVADIHVTPDQKYLYISNRGHDSLVGFEIGENGDLTLLGWTPTDGKTPRNFLITADGSFLLVANQDSDTITCFWIEENGGLTKLPTVIPCPTPVCLKMSQQ